MLAAEPGHRTRRYPRRGRQKPTRTAGIPDPGPSSCGSLRLVWHSPPNFVTNGDKNGLCAVFGAARCTIAAAHRANADLTARRGERMGYGVSSKRSLATLTT